MKINEPGSYRMRNGKRAFILATNAPGEYPCVGYIFDEDGDNAPNNWRSNGYYRAGDMKSPQDIMAEWPAEPRRIWMPQDENGKLSGPTTECDPRKDNPGICWVEFMEVIEE